MNKKRLLVVAYRPVRFYRTYGPIVRDYKFCFMKGFDEVLVIDEIGLWQLDEDRKFRLRRINWSLNLACLFTSRRIWLAKRMEKFYKRLANEIQCDLFIVNHPLVRAWSPTANTLVDIIDNFAKHVRYSTPEKQLFGENIAAANKGGYAFLVVTNEAAKALGLRRFGWLDNLPLTNCRPESIAVRSGLVCVGFFSERVDWEVIRAVAARGIQVDLYGKFFDGVAWPKPRSQHRPRNRAFPC